HSFAECGAAAADGPVSVRAAGEVLCGRAQPGEASGEAGCGDLPREHRGHLCGYRVPRGNAGGEEVYRLRERRDAEGRQEEDSSGFGRGREADLDYRVEAAGA